MERSVASLAFKDSITEAIMESKRQKKLFVVYISGEDEESGRVENRTWIDEKVVESVMKYCILLHLPQGSTEAVQFSAIYPQTSVPCITVIGYNGVQIWQNGGFVTSETLQSTIEKAWLSLHLQETTASILTAALASKNYEPSSSDTPVEGSQEVAGIVKERPTTDPVVVDKEFGNKSRVEKSTSLVDTSQTDETVHIALPPPLEKIEESPVIEDANPSLCVEEMHVSSEHKKNVIHNEGANECEGTSSAIPREQREPKCTDDSITDRNKKISAPESNDVNLNIRLPSGTSLQRKFHMTTTLREVKAYINENQATSIISSYNLAIPYPRKVFSDQDLSLSLSELGLSNRQALIVVPNQQASGEPRVVNFARQQTDTTVDASSNSNNEGYFSYLKRALAYFNPLSYISGRPFSSNSEAPSDSTTGQYGANRGLEANRRGPGSPYGRYQQVQNQNKPEASSNSNRKNKQPTNTRFGSNIHTLKHDEDDDNRNPFWNGNSTQYNGSGGDNEDGGK